MKPDGLPQRGEHLLSEAGKWSWAGGLEGFKKSFGFPDHKVVEFQALPLPPGYGKAFSWLSPLSLITQHRSVPLPVYLPLAMHTHMLELPQSAS